MENGRIAFQTIPEGEKADFGYQYVNCHIVFDNKIEDFHGKAHLVAGGNMTHTPDVITYSSGETVCTALIMAVLHDLEVKAAKVLNAYMIASNRELIWTILGPEFGDDAGKSVIIIRVLYGLKSADALFRSHLAQCMHELG